MTTPDLPNAAIEAAAEAIAAVHTACDCPEHLTQYARDALAAALPLLGEIEPVAGDWISIPADQATTRTEYGTRVVPDVDPPVEPQSWTPDRATAERWQRQARKRGFTNRRVIVQRTVITTEWTEAPSE